MKFKIGDRVYITELYNESSDHGEPMKESDKLPTNELGTVVEVDGLVYPYSVKFDNKDLFSEGLYFFTEEELILASEKEQTFSDFTLDILDNF